MTEIASLQIRVDALEAKAATDAMNKMVPAAGKAEKSVDKLSTASKEFGKVIGGLAAALAGGVFFQAVIRNTIESESALAQLNATIKSTGGAAGLSSDQMVAMAQGLQKVTTFGDDAIISMQSQLLTFTKIGGDVVPRATEAILDLATKMGGDLKGAAVQVGKALNDPIKGVAMLGKSGVQFSEDQQQMITALVETGRLAEAQTVILAELETQFGGSAKAARDTFGGAVTALQNAFGDLLEGDGGNLKDAKEGVESLTKALSDPQVQMAFGQIVGGIFQVTTAIANALPKLTAFTTWAAESLAASFSGAAIGDLPRLMDELATLERKAATDRDRNKDGELRRGLEQELALTRTKIQLTEEMDFEAERQKALAEDLILLQKEQTTTTTGLTTATVTATTEAERETAAKLAAKKASEEKREALKAEKTATDALIKAQRDTAKAGEDALAFAEQQRNRVGAADPIIGAQQAHAKEMDELRTLDANKLIEHQRYLDLKGQAERAHAEQMRILQEENFRAQSYGNELLMASLDQLQQGATDAFVGILTGATNSREAVQQLASSILNEAVGALVEMGIAQVKSIIMGQAAQTAATATSVAAGAATAAAWTPAAAAASIASFGGAAASGLASMASAIPAMIGLLSFEGGGFTGTGSRSGGMDGKGGFMAMVHPNETIIDHTKGQPAGGSGVTVNVIQSSEKAGTQETKQNADGSQSVDVFVSDIYGDGPRARALQNAFGLKRSGK